MRLVFFNVFFWKTQFVENLEMTQIEGDAELCSLHHYNATRTKMCY